MFPNRIHLLEGTEDRIHDSEERAAGWRTFQTSYCSESPLMVRSSISPPLNSFPILFSGERVAFGPWNIRTVHFLGFGSFHPSKLCNFTWSKNINSGGSESPCH